MTRSQWGKKGIGRREATADLGEEEAALMGTVRRRLSRSRGGRARRAHVERQGGGRGRKRVRWSSHVGRQGARGGEGHAYEHGGGGLEAVEELGRWSSRGTHQRVARRRSWTMAHEEQVGEVVDDGV